MAVAPDGSVYVVGTTHGAIAELASEGIEGKGGSDQDYFVLKLDENGEEVWSTRGGTTHGPDFAQSVAVDRQAMSS